MTPTAPPRELRRTTPPGIFPARWFPQDPRPPCTRIPRNLRNGTQKQTAPATPARPMTNSPCRKAALPCTPFMETPIRSPMMRTAVPAPPPRIPRRIWKGKGFRQNGGSPDQRAKSGVQGMEHESGRHRRRLPVRRVDRNRDRKNVTLYATYTTGYRVLYDLNGGAGSVNRRQPVL